MQSENLYEILNVSKNASQDEIKKSFRKLAMEYHPDKNSGNKEFEEKFKKINEAYTVLSNEETRKTYDMFGSVNAVNNGQTGGMPPDINDIFKNMFGGFSFSFNNPPEDIFNGFPGFGNPRKKHQNADVISIDIDINDIYYGNTKKVEFEVLEQCSKCNGTGASDPSNIVKCITCNGNGVLTQQLGPMFFQRSTCPSCMGKGNMIKNNKFCTSCKGEKTVYGKRVFELKIPKGIPNNHEIKMDKKGSFMVADQSVKDIIIKFKYKIDPPYELDENMDVTITVPITIEELVGGFKKEMIFFKENVVLISDRYFNPTREIIIKEKGIYNIKRQKNSDIKLKFKIEFIDSERLSKYHGVIQKCLKIPTPSSSQDDNMYRIQSLMNY